MAGSSARNWLALAAVVMALAALALGYFYFSVRPLIVTVAKPEKDVLIEVFGLGTVEARTISHMGFEVAGTLIELNGDFGDQVTKGAVLARLHDREQVARVASAEAVAAQAQASLSQTRAGFERAEVALRQKESISLRRAELARRGASSSETSEDAQAAFEIAQADVAVAKSAIEVAEANVLQAAALAEVEKAKLAKFTLAAPFRGTIVARQRELGSILNPGETLFTLVDPESVWVLAYVDEAKSGQIQVGQPVEVVLRSQGDTTFRGRVARIDIESDRVNEERRVYVTCEKCPTAFFLGEQAEVVIAVATLPEALLMPIAAVSDLQGNSGTVWTLVDGELAQRVVRFGQRTRDGRLEIVSGLQPGAEVVIQLIGGLSPGRAAKAAGGE
ncbi:MAG: efflux RND transporter periplasmic adaptor subunit [Mesorhizobium sp.]|nr:efflux RND transporter periplasmic adaptor subunit [Mesorhizobium sp.]